MGGFANNAPIVTDGLVFYVDAGNSKSYDGVSGGTTWTDLVGGNDGTLTNMETNPVNAGYVYDSGNGGSISFDGTNDYTISSDSISFVNGGQRSLEVWINPAPPYGTVSQGVIWAGEASSQKLFEILLTQNHPAETNFRVIGHYYGAGNDMGNVNSTYNVIPSQWNHIVLTQNGSTHKIYVNGSLTATKSANITASSSGQVRIGRESWSGADYCTAKYGVCKYYNKELSASEVLQNYNALKNRFV